MGDIWRIALGAGLQDGFNPCTFLTCAVFIVFGMRVGRHYPHLGWLRLFFILTYGLCVLFFDFGPVGLFLFHKVFVLTAKIIYLVLGVGSFGLGVWFFKDWFMAYRHTREDVDIQETSLPQSGWIIFLITSMLVVVLSALATIWPANYYLTLLGSGWIINGQWQSVIVLLMGYTLVSLWPLWLLWSFLSIKTMRPALLKIVCASVFFVASSSVILIFK
jgi:hypothetical protein